MKASRTAILTIAALFTLTSAIIAGDNSRSDNVAQFDLGSVQQESRSADSHSPRPDFRAGAKSTRRSVGSVLSPDAGIGKGASIDLSFEDAQNFVGQGRHISHWWNGEYGGSAKVSLHFGYRSMTDTLSGYPDQMSSYNVYDAVAGDWPRGQETGCDLQAGDTLGSGYMPSLDVMSNGQVVMASESHFLNGFLGDGSVFIDHQIFYQSGEFGCTYAPGVNTTFIDSASSRANFLDQTDGNYSDFPQVVTQWDGTNTVVHMLLIEETGVLLYGDDYVNGEEYRSCVYFRKTGETADAGAWSAGKIIDSLSFPWASMAAAPFPYANVVVSYTNPGYYGALLNNWHDRDVWYRESPDRGLTWQEAWPFAVYTTAIPGHWKYPTAWLETQALYTSDGDLHVVWTAKETSDDPYFDGFNWNGFDQNIYHWARSHGEITQVADGSYTDGWECLLGTIHTLHCGFGGSNACYVANVNIAECDEKLYCVWNQIHERANNGAWREGGYFPTPGILDDCSVVGERLAMANWEIMMSVARLESSRFWDNARNVSDTYTPRCGLPGYEGHEEAEGPCGSEYKPTVEPYGLDESGLSLTWPSEALVDMNPEAYGPYTGTCFLNMQYVDDQFPGPASWGRSNPPASLNSLKWIRLACVDPIEASQIQVSPVIYLWPEWVELGQVTNLMVTVVNEGNVTLNVTEIGWVETSGSGWLSTSINPTPAAPFQIAAGPAYEAMFDMIIDASGISETTWLGGEVWLKSDALNNDSVSIYIHTLAASEVEPVVWDTVVSHSFMFDTYFYPEGECVALAVSNHGEIGYGAGGGGSVNLDYVESETECGDRLVDGIYLKSGSAFTITADDANGANAQLTSSYNHANQTPEYGWDPHGHKGSMTGGLSSGGEYDSVYTGVFVNRDTSIAMERTFYAPRSSDPENETINFVVCYSKFYSGDGAGHNHVTIGNVCDWNVPSEAANMNTSGLSDDGFVYMQGTDSTGVLSCQSHTGRFATEAFARAYLSTPGDMCGSAWPYSVNSLSQTTLVDTSHYRDGTDLVPDGPLPDVWWTETGVAGMNADATVQNQAIWTTYVHDYSLGASDTLNYWTVISTVRDGSLADLEAQVAYATAWLSADGAGGMALCDKGCCVGRVGDANGIGGDEPTIGDVSVMIGWKFIIGNCFPGVPCLDEADVNQTGPPSGATCGDITIGDISILIDYLFITGPSLGLPNCSDAYDYQ